MVSESCAPYAQDTKSNKCSNFAKCPPKAKIINTEFVGKGFAEVTETQMMQDILRNGPASVDFLANDVFANYKDGIISEKGIQAMLKKDMDREKVRETHASPVAKFRGASLLEALFAHVNGAQSTFFTETMIEKSKTHYSDCEATIERILIDRYFGQVIFLFFYTSS